MEDLAEKIRRQHKWLRLCYELYPEKVMDPMSWESWMAKAVAEFLVNRVHVQAALMQQAMDIKLREVEIYVPSNGNSLQNWTHVFEQLILANENDGKTLQEIIARVMYIAFRIDEHAEDIVERRDGIEAITHRHYQQFEAQTEQYLVDQEEREEQERLDIAEREEAFEALQAAHALDQQWGADWDDMDVSEDI